MRHANHAAATTSLQHKWIRANTWPACRRVQPKSHCACIVNAEQMEARNDVRFLEITSLTTFCLSNERVEGVAVKASRLAFRPARDTRNGCTWRAPRRSTRSRQTGDRSEEHTSELQSQF